MVCVKDSIGFQVSGLGLSFLNQAAPAAQIQFKFIVLNSTKVYRLFCRKDLGNKLGT